MHSRSCCSGVSLMVLSSSILTAPSLSPASEMTFKSLFASKGLTKKELAPRYITSSLTAVISYSAVTIMIGSSPSFFSSFMSGAASKPAILASMIITSGMGFSFTYWSKTMPLAFLVIANAPADFKVFAQDIPCSGVSLPMRIFKLLIWTSFLNIARLNRDFCQNYYTRCYICCFFYSF